VSLQRIKGAMDEALRETLTISERQAAFARLFAILVRDMPGLTLHIHVPTRVTNIELRRRQGELFADLPQREAAKLIGCSEATAWRDRQLIQSRTVSESAA